MTYIQTDVAKLLEPFHEAHLLMIRSRSISMNRIDTRTYCIASRISLLIAFAIKMFTVCKSGNKHERSFFWFTCAGCVNIVSANFFAFKDNVVRWENVGPVIACLQAYISQINIFYQKKYG